MLLFGHIGITMGVVKAAELLLYQTKPTDSHQSGSSLKLGGVKRPGRWQPSHCLRGIRGWFISVDYRLVLLGSLLPDIIDKSVWFLTNQNFSLSGRDYAHTLLFNLVWFITGLVLRQRYKKSWLLVLSLSSLMHLVFDQMWRRPTALLWPLLGSLPKEETTGWLASLFYGLFSSPAVYVPEIIGLVIVLLFTYQLIVRRRVTSFLKSGVID